MLLYLIKEKTKRYVDYHSIELIYAFLLSLLGYCLQNDMISLDHSGASDMLQTQPNTPPQDFALIISRSSDLHLWSFDTARQALGY